MLSSPCYRAYNGCEVGEILFRSNGNGLHQELILAFGTWGRLLFHGLKDDCQAVSYESVKMNRHVQPCTSTSLFGSTRPELGLTQYLNDTTCQYLVVFKRIAVVVRETDCFGAVVLT